MVSLEALVPVTSLSSPASSPSHLTSCTAVPSAGALATAGSLPSASAPALVSKTVFAPAKGISVGSTGDGASAPVIARDTASAPVSTRGMAAAVLNSAGDRASASASAKDRTSVSNSAVEHASASAAAIKDNAPVRALATPDADNALAINTSGEGGPASVAVDGAHAPSESRSLSAVCERVSAPGSREASPSPAAKFKTDTTVVADAATKSDLSSLEHVPVSENYLVLKCLTLLAQLPGANYCLPLASLLEELASMCSPELEDTVLIELCLEYAHLMELFIDAEGELRVQLRSGGSSISHLFAPGSYQLAAVPRRSDGAQFASIKPASVANKRLMVKTDNKVARILLAASSASPEAASTLGGAGVVTHSFGGLSSPDQQPPPDPVVGVSGSSDPAAAEVSMVLAPIAGGASDEPDILVAASSGHHSLEKQNSVLVFR